MIHFDTHVLVWVVKRRGPQFPAVVRRLLASTQPRAVSPMVEFELDVLFDSGKLDQAPDDILRVARDELGASLSTTPFADIIKAARTFAWTRDPFDRLIVANAMADGARLLTADETIRRHFKDAVW